MEHVKAGKAERIVALADGQSIGSVSEKFLCQTGARKSTAISLKEKEGSVLASRTVEVSKSKKAVGVKDGSLKDALRVASFKWGGPDPQAGVKPRERIVIALLRSIELAEGLRNGQQLQIGKGSNGSSKG